MTKTIILVFHPDLARSRANRALADAAVRMADTETVDIQSIYRDRQIDTQTEVQRLVAADRIVFQFPIQWYCPPPILQAWQNEVLTRMFYINHETEGRLIQGKPLWIAATAGNTPSAYTAQGANLLPLQDILAPLRVMANRCGLLWREPFIVYDARRATDQELQATGQHYARWLVSDQM
ncbi:MAG: NAD(P)H-dependent oxidoreductase [Phyllobacterium sp.]